MTGDQWFALGRDLVMMALGVLVFYWGQDRKKTQELMDDKFRVLARDLGQSFELRDHRLDILEQRVDRAAIKSSEEAGRIMVKIADHSERIVSLETFLERRRSQRS